MKSILVHALVYSLLVIPLNIWICLTGCVIPEPPGSAPELPGSAPEAPGIPLLVPEDARLEASWEKVNNADTYEAWHNVANDTQTATCCGNNITTTNVSICNLTNGQTYYVWIKAKNKNGTSGFGQAASAVPARPLSPPGTPSAPMITERSRQLEVNWTPATGASSYQVWYNTDDNSATASQCGGDLPGTGCVIYGLVNGTAYFVWIRAKNSDGYSGFSPCTSGTPQGPEIQIKKGEQNIPLGALGHAFPDTFDGADSPAVTFTINNQGNLALTVSSLYLGGDGADQFVLETTSTGFSIAAGAAANFTVRFHPWTVGSKTANITIVSDDADEGTFSFVLTGTGIPAPGTTWRLLSTPFSSQYMCCTSIACSADGKRVVTGIYGGSIYISDNYGKTWSEKPAANKRLWFAFAMSADGTKIAAAVWQGNIYTSTDGGETWTERIVYSKSRNWQWLVCSGDGMRLAAYEISNNTYNIFTSTDGGANWRLRCFAAHVYFLAASADGSTLALTSGKGAYTSSDWGINWTSRVDTSPADSLSITCSENGQRLAVLTGRTGDQIYSSIDGGITWRQSTCGSFPGQYIAGSADGMRLAVTPYNSSIYFSMDGGATWIQRLTPNPNNWRCIIFSADGSRLYAIDPYSSIYTSP